ncbi:hypothetical protein EJ419_07185 [Alloscardovia theropitheci]|uniref:Uncharacterized protein n=1 Tax=Alloscardovia theropitheci TaxID=2496842 RepID=A0A4R0QNH1_9BIFI|nr:hypothetical protein [Alloscardovia theropitheci]TCD53742.1 hypothetical protein EJ419_07185 [Alloscardovia theropitheci]
MHIKSINLIDCAASRDYSLNELDYSELNTNIQFSSNEETTNPRWNHIVSIFVTIVGTPHNQKDTINVFTLALKYGVQAETPSDEIMPNLIIALWPIIRQTIDHKYYEFGMTDPNLPYELDIEKFSRLNDNE